MEGISVWLILIVVIVLSGFFSGIEIAFVSANKLRLEIDKGRGGLGAAALRMIVSRPPRLIATLLIGNNFALVIYGLIMAILLENPLQAMLTKVGLGESEMSLLLLQTVISSSVILLVAEYLPKAIFSANPNYYLKSLSIPIWIFYQLFYVPVILVVRFTQWFIRNFLRSKVEESDAPPERIDLGVFLSQLTAGSPDPEEAGEHEVQILQKALEFPNLKARECMVPRTEIVALPLDVSLSELRQKFVSTGHSKIIIYRGDLDEVLGYVHSYDLFRNPNSLASMLLPIQYVPETMPVKDILSQFIQQRKSISIVVDEYGGTSGLITLEDIIEEIFGEIEDEHDKEDLIEEQIDENNYIFSGRLEIDYLNTTYQLEIPPSEEYETLAGFILHHHTTIPPVGESVEIAPFSFEITKGTAARIEEVRMNVLGDKV
jgi:putative hemolysin